MMTMMMMMMVIIFIMTMAMMKIMMVMRKLMMMMMLKECYLGRGKLDTLTARSGLIGTALRLLLFVVIVIVIG